jgi:hypothetical protein
VTNDMVETSVASLNREGDCAPPLVCDCS